MNTQELHIGVNQILQKVNSNATFTFKPEEIDWALNEETIRIIKQRVNPRSNEKKQGFEDTQKRYDDIRALIVKNYYLPAYIDNNDSVFSFLPANYFQLVNDRCIVTSICNTTFSSFQTQSKTLNYAVWRVPSDSYRLFQIFDLKLNGTVIYSRSESLASVKSYFVLINEIIEVLLKNGIQAKYEVYGNIYEQGAIIVYGGASTIDLTYVYEQAIHNIVEVLFSWRTITLQGLISIPTSNREVVNRLTDTEFLYNVLDSSLVSTNIVSPVTNLESNNIVGWHKQKFIISGFKIDFIRKPRKISLSLNISSDLPESIQNELIENTAKRLAGITDMNTYRNIINENLLKE